MDLAALLTFVLLVILLDVICLEQIHYRNPVFKFLKELEGETICSLAESIAIGIPLIFLNGLTWPTLLQCFIYVVICRLGFWTIWKVYSYISQDEIEPKRSALLGLYQAKLVVSLVTGIVILWLQK